MKVGRYEVTTHNHGFFRLDGGAMFGSVPKALWNREAPADDANRILLATRSLIIRDGSRKMLIDVGCGDKWNDKTRAIFAIPDTPYKAVDSVTDVLLTHLHFDHGGGVSRFEGEQLVPCYPDATHHVSRANLENAKNPNVREKASYLRENYGILDEVSLNLTEDGDEIWPGISVHQAHGHTKGLTWVKISDDGVTLAYPADLIPTSKHLPVPYVMGYDMCAETAMREKGEFISQAVEGGWIVVFEHDPEIGAGRVSFDERGRPVLESEVELT